MLVDRLAWGIRHPSSCATGKPGVPGSRLSVATEIPKTSAASFSLTHRRAVSSINRAARKSWAPMSLPPTGSRRNLSVTASVDPEPLHPG